MGAGGEAGGGVLILQFKLTVLGQIKSQNPVQPQYCFVVQTPYDTVPANNATCYFHGIPMWFKLKRFTGTAYSNNYKGLKKYL